MKKKVATALLSGTMYPIFACVPGNPITAHDIAQMFT